jgi:hypothetical protein
MVDPVYDYYSVDANIMITLNILPHDVFKPAWDEISRLASTDRWKIFEIVTDEIHGETANKWLADNDSAIVKWNSEINEYTNKLMADLQRKNMMLIDPSRLKNNADPFVIILALYLEKRNLNNLREKVGNKTCCVLTNETPKKNKINIPHVCEYFNIPYMNFPKFIRHHRWRIRLDVQNP